MAPLSRHETRGSESTVLERPDPEEDLLAPEEDLLAPEEDLLAPEEDLLVAGPLLRRRRRWSMSQPPNGTHLSPMKKDLTLSDKLDIQNKRCMSSCHSSQFSLHSGS